MLLSLNISREDNSLNLNLVQHVASFFRLPVARANTIMQEVCSAVRGWRDLARILHIPPRETNLMQHAFRVADSSTPTTAALP